jgi:hypothetical protein
MVGILGERLASPGLVCLPSQHLDNQGVDS